MIQYNCKNQPSLIYHLIITFKQKPKSNLTRNSSLKLVIVKKKKLKNEVQNYPVTRLEKTNDVEEEIDIEEKQDISK